MGVLHGRDLFSSKYITAEITDSSNRLHYVPIRFVIGDYFLTDINRQTYCFKIDGSRIKYYQETAVKSFRVIQYDINHYLPVSAKDNKELEDLLIKNTLPKVDNMLLSVFKYLGNKEKHNPKQFEVHDLSEMFEEAAKLKDDLPEETQNLINYLNGLESKQIVSPVRKISEFLEGELMTTEPKFLGTIVSAYQRTDVEQKKMSNTPIGPKHAWMKLALVLIIIVMLVAAIVIGWSMGLFNNLIPQFGNFAPSGAVSTTPGGGTSSGTLTSNSLLTQYPTPESMVNAIHDKTLSCTSLPKDIKGMVNNYKSGTCP